MNMVKNRPLLENIKQLVENDFCIGCGICAAVCPDGQLKMEWNQIGALQPVALNGECNECTICASVCPFADGVIRNINNPTEDELGEKLFGVVASQKETHVGYYQGLYAGFTQEFRMNGSSGGVTTWILAKLLEKKIVDRVICVQPNEIEGPFFEFRVCSTIEEVKAGSKSRYYPVHLADVLDVVLTEDAKFAIVGLPCFIKGIRLAQIQNEVLRERIIFCAGIFCGGLKTAYFTEFLAAQLDILSDEILKPQYRIKKEGESSHGYHFGCENRSNNGEFVELNLKKLKDLWGPGFFKYNVCDYCDDVVGEVADISTGDAWLQPFSSDWRGTNIVITRSEIAQTLVKEGLESGSLNLTPFTTKQVVQSQVSTFEHRRVGLAYRLHWAQGKAVPRKRIQPERPTSLIKGMITRGKIQVRNKSHTAWQKQKGTRGTVIFDRLIYWDLNKLRALQLIDRQLIKLKIFIRKIISGQRNA